MRKRDKSLITVLVVIPIICIILVIIGLLFDSAKFVAYIILSFVLITVLTKIIMTIITLYKSYISK